SRADVERMVRTHVDKDAEQGDDVEISDGELAGTWQSWTDAGGDYALTRTYRRTTVLVVGTAGEDTIASVATALAADSRSVRVGVGIRVAVRRGVVLGEHGVQPGPGAIEPARADARELLAALPQSQRLLEVGAAGLEGADDLDQLVARLLVAQFRLLTHGRSPRSVGRRRSSRRARRRPPGCGRRSPVPRPRR